MTKHGIEPLPSGHEIMEHIVKSVIGEGGFGIVYLAEHPKLNIRAAVKEFAPFKLAHRDASGALVPNEGKEALYNQILDRFDKTAAQLCALTHPNIVKVFNQRSDNNTSYVLMEFVTGQTFGEWVQNRIKELDYSQLKDVLLPLLDAIEYLHDQHLMHRDIAPDNILMREDGVPILIDFGTLKQHVLGEETNLEDTEPDDPSAVVAKKFFSPPEQFSSYRKSELRSTADIYSLGATIYDVLAGRADDMTRHLVPATDRASNVVAPGGRPMPPLRDVSRVDLPEAFCNAVDTALNLSPRDRPQSIAAFRELLFREDAAVGASSQSQQDLTQPLGSTTPAPSSPQGGPSSPGPSGVGAASEPNPPSPTTAGFRWGRVIGGTSVVAAVAAGLFFAFGGEPTPPTPDPDTGGQADVPNNGSTTPFVPVDSGQGQVQDQAQGQTPDQSPGQTQGEAQGQETGTIAALGPTPEPGQTLGTFTPPSLDQSSETVVGTTSPSIAPATVPTPPSNPALDDMPNTSTETPPIVQPIAPPPEFRLDLARSVSGLTASGVVPPELFSALEAIFGAGSVGAGVVSVEGVSPPDAVNVSQLAQIVRTWRSFTFSIGPNGARLQGEPSNAQSYFQAINAAGDAVDLDLNFLTTTLPRNDVLALLDFHDPCGTIIPLDLGTQLTPSDRLSLFGHVASVQQGRELTQELVLLLPGTLDGDRLTPTSDALCNVAWQFRDLVSGSVRQVDSFQIAMDGARPPLGEPVSHTQTPQFAVSRSALPASGYFWSGLVMRGPGRSLIMLPLSQPSGHVEDLSLLTRGANTPPFVALTQPMEGTPNIDLAFRPELGVSFDPTDTYAMLLGLVLDREITGLPTLGATEAPEAGEYIAALRAAVERSGATILSHFQDPIAIE